MFTTFYNQASLTKLQLVVDFDGEKPIYMTQTLEDLIYAAEAEDTQVYIISITGVFRTGKSFFLCLFKTYLDYICVVIIMSIISK